MKTIRRKYRNRLAPGVINALLEGGLLIVAAETRNNPNAANIHTAVMKLINSTPDLQDRYNKLIAKLENNS